jgi:hypothetical protein
VIFTIAGKQAARALTAGSVFWRLSRCLRCRGLCGGYSTQTARLNPRYAMKTKLQQWGAVLIVMGVVSLILPALGMQLRILNPRALPTARSAAQRLVLLTAFADGAEKLCPEPPLHQRRCGLSQIVHRNLFSDRSSLTNQLPVFEDSSSSLPGGVVTRCLTFAGPKAFYSCLSH